MDVTAQATRLSQEIKKQARMFTDDNFTNPTPMDYLIIENAFLCGAATAAVVQTEQERIADSEDPQ